MSDFKARISKALSLVEKMEKLSFEFRDLQKLKVLIPEKFSDYAFDYECDGRSQGSVCGGEEISFEIDGDGNLRAVFQDEYMDELKPPTLKAFRKRIIELESYIEDLHDDDLEEKNELMECLAAHIEADRKGKDFTKSKIFKDCISFQKEFSKILSRVTVINELCDLLG